MSMVARTNPGPAEDDITDTDDGDTVHTHKHGGVKGGSDSTGGPQ